MYDVDTKKTSPGGGKRWRAGEEAKSAGGGSGGHKKKKGIYPRHPIFVNLKSNTMKNTVQR